MLIKPSSFGWAQVTSSESATCRRSIQSCRPPILGTISKSTLTQNWSLQRPPLRILFISSWPASVRAEFCWSPGSEHCKVQRNLSCHPRRATLAPDQKAHRVQNCSSRATLPGRRCARVLDGTVSSCQFGRRSAKPPVCFQRRPYHSLFQTPNIWFPNFCYLGPSALELTSIGR